MDQMFWTSVFSYCIQNYQKYYLSFVRRYRFRRAEKIEKKATISFIMCLPIDPPPVRLEQLGSQWTNFHEILYLRNFRIPIESLKASLKSDKNEWAHYMTTFVHTDNISLNTSYNDKYFRQSCTENQHKQFIVNMFPKSCRLLDSVGKRGRLGQATDNNTVWRMHFGCWITKATDTHIENVILIAFPRQHSSRQRASMLRLYVHCLPCLFH